MLSISTDCSIAFKAASTPDHHSFEKSSRGVLPLKKRYNRATVPRNAMPNVIRVTIMALVGI